RLSVDGAISPSRRCGADKAWRPGTIVDLGRVSMLGGLDHLPSRLRRASMKRFYKEVGVADRGILLDGKALRTPRGAALVLPTDALAEAVADEWRAQGDEIVPSEMPLTKLANTAIDGVVPRRDEVIAEI